MDNDDLTPHIGKLLKQQREALHLTLQQVARDAGVSLSYLGRVERGERYPSGTTLMRLAKPLRFTDEELMHLAGYLTAMPKEDGIAAFQGHLDPLVAKVLAVEPVERQRQVVAILLMMKSMAKDGASGETQRE